MNLQRTFKALGGISSVDNDMIYWQLSAMEPPLRCKQAVKDRCQIKRRCIRSVHLIMAVVTCVLTWTYHVCMLRRTWFLSGWQDHSFMTSVGKTGWHSEIDNYLTRILVIDRIFLSSWIPFFTGQSEKRGIQVNCLLLNINQYSFCFELIDM